MTKASILSILLFLILACKPKSCKENGLHDTIYFENKSNRVVEYKILGNYPDTIYPDGNNPTTDKTEPILPNSVGETKKGCVHSNKECCFEDVYENDKYYWLYIFDQDSINLLSWDTVRISGRGLLERRKIDLEHLVSNNFKLVYEP